MIVFIINSLNNAGAEKQLLRRVKVLSSKSDIIVVTLLPNGTLKEEFEFHAKVICLDIKSIKFIRNFLLLSFFLLRNRNSVKCISSWLYLADLIGFVLGAFTGIKWIINIRCTEVSSDSRITLFARWLVGKLSRFSETIIYCSESAAHFHKKIGFMSKQQCHILGNGFEFNSPVDVFSKVSRLHGKPVIFLGLVSRFDPLKNVNDFISLVENLNSNNTCNTVFKAIMSGKGMEWSNNNLHTAIKTYSKVENFILTGDTINVHDLYKKIDIVVSSSRTEGFSNVICEAILNGCYVVSTDVGAAKECLIYEDYLFEVGDIDAATNCILNLINDPQNLNKWREQHANIVDNFDLEKITERYANLLEGV